MERAPVQPRAPHWAWPPAAASQAGPAAWRARPAASRTAAPPPPAQRRSRRASSRLRPGIEPWFMSLQIENGEGRRGKSAVQHATLGAEALTRPQIGERHRVALLPEGRVFIHCNLLFHAVQPVHLDLRALNRPDLPCGPRLPQALARLAYLFRWNIDQDRRAHRLLLRIHIARGKDHVPHLNIGSTDGVA